IHVLCYPSHLTHIYQGLDVVIFSSLKCAWSDEYDQFEWNHGKVTKTNFMVMSCPAPKSSLALSS
ncbi:MAG: hypothetical protein NXY57DRAFT_907756, partial [Lentinula lateritia]